ncbi:MAG: DUF1584 domain-containing protein [Planctomycetaceae bacterium]|nr:MAG: DUF1584 domain-containing protein [Planctomycetaceae bacterium]
MPLNHSVRLAEGRKPSGIAVADEPDGSRRAAKSLRQVSGRAQALRYCHC